MTTLFFELLQISIGTRDCFSRVPASYEWLWLFDESQRQAIEGIMACGLERLPKEQQPPQDILLQWIGATLQIEQQNALTSKACKDVVSQFEKDGFLACVLKGQANHRYYHAEIAKRRNCGDVDVWVEPIQEFKSSSSSKGSRGSTRQVLEYVADHWERTGLCWLHCNFTHGSGVPVEVHFHPSFLNEPIRNRRFFKLFADFNDCVCQKEIDDGVVIPAMKPEYDIIFQMNHIYRHLIDEGVGLRQIVDYYFLLIDNGQLIIDNSTKIMRTVERLGMKRFAGALMYVLREICGMKDELLLCPVSVKDGRFLLNEIMIAGNFGHNDPRMGALASQTGLKRQLSQAGRRFKRNLRFLTCYPGEVIWEPFARMWHFAWKKGIMFRYKNVN